ncbi:phytanoyl-CoA dioxygenase family protein [Iamia majanohamensis]|uniref:Phytanoyl-CoA dioxygenase family protein n=1 Tax=Iamia majanohamensis TaxID=467976 RepID=A0AAE9Y5L4_9ACTN|nr:phytanoyl-CoA dioxygenase family protein [Iamia majanohamensis]WCO65881.1 phytanoyl-CoA dioxygenase family protein [Iamia majanohamensis]
MTATQPRATLADPARQAELERFGFAVVPFLDPDLLTRVREAAATIGPAPDDPQVALNWTFHSQSSEHKHRVKRELDELTRGALDATLVDHVAYLTTFITKWPGPHSAFAPHQDPTLVDERSHRGVTVWVPLTDTGRRGGRDNGMLHVVPGSHAFSSAARVQDVDQFQFAEHEDAILRTHGVGVPTVAGEALVFDNRLVHYSLPNATPEPRVVLSFAVRPREADCVILRADGDGRVAMHRIHDDFYIDVLPAEQHLWEPPGPPADTFATSTPRIDAAEFARLCAAVGPAPRTVEGVPASGIDPGAFCALCGGAEGIEAGERDGRNNAQLVCRPCRQRLAQQPASRARRT